VPAGNFLMRLIAQHGLDGAARVLRALAKAGRPSPAFVVG